MRGNGVGVQLWDPSIHVRKLIKIKHTSATSNPRPIKSDWSSGHFVLRKISFTLFMVPIWKSVSYLLNTKFVFFFKCQMSNFLLNTNYLIFVKYQVSYFWSKKTQNNTKKKKNNTTQKKISSTDPTNMVTYGNCFNITIKIKKKVIILYNCFIISGFMSGGHLS